MKEKSIIIFIIILSFLLFIGGIFLGTKIAKTECETCRCDCSNVQENPTYDIYSDVQLSNNYEIISSSDELNSLLDETSKTDQSSYNIKDKYKNFDFSNNQLLFINSSGSGCDNSNFPKIEKLEIKENSITIYLAAKPDEITCDAYHEQIYILTIEKGNYTDVVFTNNQ